MKKLLLLILPLGFIISATTGCTHSREVVFVPVEERPAAPAPKPKPERPEDFRAVERPTSYSN